MFQIRGWFHNQLIIITKRTKKQIKEMAISVISFVFESLKSLKHAIALRF